jgi:hypothetical protein
LIARFVEFFVVSIHRFDVLSVDLHCHKFSSPNSSYFSQNRRFSLPICAKPTYSSCIIFSKKSEPAKAGPAPGQRPHALPARSTRIDRPQRRCSASATHVPAARAAHLSALHRPPAHAPAQPARSNSASQRPSSPPRASIRITAPPASCFACVPAPHLLANRPPQPPNRRPARR